MNKTIVNGIDCFGKAEIGANYEVTFDDEMKDFIATDIEASSWAGVVKQLAKFDGVEQIVAV